MKIAARVALLSRFVHGWCRQTRQGLALSAAATFTAAAAAAPPTVFSELGTYASPAAPPYALTHLDDGSFLSVQSPPETLTVKWARFELTSPIEGEQYLDFSARVFPSTPLAFALYNSVGTLVAADFGAQTGTPLLSFGSTRERVPLTDGLLRGQNGPTLPAGVYWFAIAAGTPEEVTFAQEDWQASTTGSTVIGFDEGAITIDLAAITGNTVPPPQPPNDACENALDIGENMGGQPAWAGTIVGATQDGTSTCYPPLPGVTFKDVWFRYIPSVTGWAEVNPVAAPGNSISPLLTRYADGCGSAQVRCAGGGSFVAAGGVRLRFPVVQGVPVLLSLAGRAGSWGALRLNITAVERCDLGVPPSAVSEVETGCDATSNNGCAFTPNAFEPLTIGQPVFGALTSSGAFRDIDAFVFQLSEGATLPVVFRTRQPAQLTVVRPNGPTGCGGLNFATLSTLDIDEGCTNLTTTLSLFAGRYYVFVQPRFTDNVACLDWFGEYWFAVGDVPAPCPADFDGNGLLNPDDLSDFITCYFELPPCAAADFDDNQIVNPDDLSDFITAYFSGC
jgi:hypothetical protein